MTYDLTELLLERKPQLGDYCHAVPFNFEEVGTRQGIITEVGSTYVEILVSSSEYFTCRPDVTLIADAYVSVHYTQNIKDFINAVRDRNHFRWYGVNEGYPRV